jgi:hypothetical protein
MTINKIINPLFRDFIQILQFAELKKITIWFVPVLNYVQGFRFFIVEIWFSGS